MNKRFTIVNIVVRTFYVMHFSVIQKYAFPCLFLKHSRLQKNSRLIRVRPEEEYGIGRDFASSDQFFKNSRKSDFPLNNALPTSSVQDNPHLRINAKRVQKGLTRNNKFVFCEPVKIRKTGDPNSIFRGILSVVRHFFHKLVLHQPHIRINKVMRTRSD